MRNLHEKCRYFCLVTPYLKSVTEVFESHHFCSFIFHLIECKMQSLNRELYAIVQIYLNSDQNLTNWSAVQDVAEFIIDVSHR